MSTPPDSASTKHSLTMVQRQYIDSRFEESVGEYMQSILETLKDISVEIIGLRSKLTIISHRIHIIEGVLQQDDKGNNSGLSLNKPPENAGL